MTRIKGARIRYGAALAAVAVLAGCGTTDGTEGGQTVATGMQAGQLDANQAEVRDGGAVTYSIEVDVKNWNILHATGDVFGYRQILNPVLPHAMISMPDFTMAKNDALLLDAKVVKESPQTVEYTIRAEAAWSDGTPITAEDFKYTWQVQDPGQCSTCQPATTAGYDQVASVTGGEGKTVTVTFEKTYQPWRLMFPYLLPAHIAAQHGDLAASFNDFFATTVPTWSGGPYLIEQHVPNQSVTMRKNPKWYGDGPRLDQLIFRILTDERQAVTAMANNEIQVVAPRPTLDLVEQLKGIGGVTTMMASGLLYEHLDINTAHPALSDQALRRAVFTAIDRKAIVDKTIGQFSPNTEPLGNRNFMPGQKLEGTDAYKDNVTGKGLGGGQIDAAKKILTDAGYTIGDAGLTDPKGKPVPTLRMRYSKGNQMRLDTSVLVQNQLKQLGITLQLQETDSLGTTVNTGDFDLIVFGTNLDVIPTATAQSVFGSKGTHTGYKDSEVDGWLSDAAQTLDPKQVVDLLNKVDERISDQAVTLPLYQTPTLLAYRGDLGNIRVNPTRFGTGYNVQEWGVKNGG
ncbi:ABC transporter family substrate-binding protein [Streptosporangium sp. NPDC000239]|uniref:ABC transporter family substrate-binding protein n=1 Tax=Streptosporangium sp. NPDC000239 TaxID=3154248 RepID=UPI003324E257